MPRNLKPSGGQPRSGQPNRAKSSSRSDSRSHIRPPEGGPTHCGLGHSSRKGEMRCDGYTSRSRVRAGRSQGRRKTSARPWRLVGGEAHRATGSRAIERADDTRHTAQVPWHRLLDAPKGAGAAKGATTVHDAQPLTRGSKTERQFLLSEKQPWFPAARRRRIAASCSPHRERYGLRVSDSRITRGRLRKDEPSHLFRRSGRGSRWRVSLLSERRTPRLAPHGVAGLADGPQIGRAHV